MESLGRGPVSEVWRAEDPVTGQTVALKVFDQIGDDIFRQRFRRETEIGARMRSDHIAEIYGVEEVGGRLCVAMQWIDGHSLESILRDGPLEPERAVTLVEQVASGLDTLHGFGAVHGNLKPANIVVATNGDAYLTDIYSASRALVDSDLRTVLESGMNPYRAPESFSSDSWDRRVDVYALACVFYQCLTGERPFAGDDLAQLITAHLTAAPPKPSATRADIPGQLDAVIAKGMAKNPDERYSAATELARAARTALYG